MAVYILQIIKRALERVCNMYTNISLLASSPDSAQLFVAQHWKSWAEPAWGRGYISLSGFVDLVATNFSGNNIANYYMVGCKRHIIL